MSEINVDVILPSALNVNVTSPTQSLAANVGIPGPQGPRGEKGNPTTINSLTAENVIISGADGNIVSTNGIETIYISGNSGYFQSLINTTNNNLLITGSTLQAEIDTIVSNSNITGTNLQNEINTLTTNLATTGSTLSANLNTTGTTLQTRINTLTTNLNTTGTTLQTNINTLTTNLNTTGTTLQTNINTLTTNLATTGTTLQTRINTLATNLNTTGTTLQTRINTLATNLNTTGTTLQTNINTLATNLNTTGTTLQTNINTLTTNLATTGSTLATNLNTTGTTLQTNINTLTTNLATTGTTLQTRINTLTTNLNTTGTTLQTRINTLTTNLNTTGSTLSANLNTTGTTLSKKIDDLSGVAVLTYGDQLILGNKTFNGYTTINNLLVTGTETIVNTSVLNVADPYLLLNISGGAKDGGIFFVTGSGLTGLNDTGPIIGFDHTNKFKFGISTRNSDLSPLPDIASVQDIVAYSGVADTKFATVINLAATGSTLDTKINSLSGSSVLLYGNQSITGVKTFANTGSFDTLQITNKKLSSYNYVNSNFTFDNAYINIINSSSNITGTLPGGITSGVNYYVKNLNIGILLITGSAQRTIDGFSTINLYKNESLQLLGVNNVGYTGWVTVGEGIGVS